MSRSTAHPFCPPHPRPVARRGIVCVIAMLFLILFAMLAIGFCAATVMSSQVSANERLTATAQIAAESGMHFIRYQLASLDVPASTPSDKIFLEVSNELRAMMTGSGNLGPHGVGYDGHTIAVPDDTSTYIRLTPNGAGFRALLTDMGSGVIRVKVIGVPGGAASALGRAIEVDYVSTNKHTTVFKYGVASRGKVQVKSTASTTITGAPGAAASVLAVDVGSPSITTGKGRIDGDLAVMVNKAQVSLGGGTVGGANDPADIVANHVTVLAAAPDFPTVDASAYSDFATNTYVSGVAHQKNVRVPANTNPTFNGGDVIDGILYIESPNNVTFRGSATINGVIVFENTNDATKNLLDFKGNISAASIPPTSEFAALRARAVGLAIAAPTAAVTLSGSVDGDITGTVIGNTVSLAGSADLTLHQGSVISLGAAPLLVQGKAVNFVGSAADNPPYQGVRLRSYFKADPTTYHEVAQ
jgi:hypothetical protein